MRVHKQSKPFTAARAARERGPQARYGVSKGEGAIKNLTLYAV